MLFKVGSQHNYLILNLSIIPPPPKKKNKKEKAIYDMVHMGNFKMINEWRYNILFRILKKKIESCMYLILCTRNKQLLPLVPLK